MLARFPSQALIRRELLTNLRRPRSFVLVGVLALFCIVAVLSQWPSQEMLIMASTTVSENLVNVLGLSLLVGCALFVPGIAGSAIVSEKEQGSYDLLHVTLIPPRGIVFGKLVNVLGFYLLLMFGVLPVFGVVFFLVGVGWGDLLYRVLMVCLASLSCAAAGLLCSAWFRKGLTAIAASYVGMLAVFGAPVVLVLLGFRYFPIVFGGLDGEIGDILTIPTRILIRLFPAIPEDYSDAQFCLLTLCHIISPISAFVEESRTYLTPWRYVAGVVYQLLFTTVCFGLTVRTLRRPPKPLMAETRKPIDDAAALESRRKKFPYYLIDPLRRKKDIEDGRNPVFVKELRWGTLGRMTVLVRVFYVALMLDMIAATSFIAMFLSSQMTESIAASMVALMIVTCLFAPALLANTFTKEREQGNLDSLRMTLLTPAQIMLGKLGGGLVSLAPLLTAALAVVVLIGLFVGLAWWDAHLVSVVLQGGVTLFVCAFVALSASLFCSVRANHTSMALVTSYVLNLVLFAGLFIAAYIGWRTYVFPSIDVPVYYGLFEEFLHARRWDLSSSVYVVSASSPPMSFLRMALGGTKLGVSLWIVSMGAFSLLSVVLLADGLRVFKKRRGRG